MLRALVAYVRDSLHRLSTKLRSGPCWTTLVAEAAGLGRVSVTRVDVSGVVDPDKTYRLVAHQHRSNCAKRPVASAQLSVSAAELLRGVSLRLYSTDPALAESSHVHVWVEEGPAILEYDGLNATDVDAEFFVRCPISRGAARGRLARASRVPKRAHSDAA